MRRISCALLLLALFLLLSATAQTEAAQESIVHLYGVAYNEFGRVVARWSGSGFAVGIAGEPSDIYLTSRHVALGTGDFPEDLCRLWLLQDGAEFFANQEPRPGSGILCEVLAATDGYPDVAVIRTLEPSARPALPLQSAATVPVGAKVVSIGFPGLADTHYGRDSGMEDQLLSEGTVTDRLELVRAGNTKTLIHTAALRPGNSGGPLLNDRGNAVGINTYGFDPDVTATQFCAIEIDCGMALLDALGIPYTAVPGPGRITVRLAECLHLPGLTDASACALAAAVLTAAMAAVLHGRKKNTCQSLLP